MIAENLKRIRRILSLYPGTRVICAVKSQPLEKIMEAINAGETEFGENYAQELVEHVTALGEGKKIAWHFIGHLQRNKVKTIIPFVRCIHSVDSRELASEIDKRSRSLGKTTSVLIEVNLDEETTKTGVSPSFVEGLVIFLNSLEHIRLEGFMCLPPIQQDPEKTRPYFRRLREIRDAINGKKIYKRPLTELSMGMSQDFEIALQEGATTVRIGTGIFGERHAKG